MLNYSYISARYKQLTVQERKRLLRKLFGDNKQSITYFKRVANPGLDKLEVLADCLDVPLDMLRTDSKYMLVPKGSVNEPTRSNKKTANHLTCNTECHYGRIYVTTSTL